MKILLTGATGVIGQYVIRELLEQGYEVIGLDRRISDRLDRLPPAIRDDVLWVECDTRDHERLKGAVRSAGAVIHLAAGASFLMYEEFPLEHTMATIAGFHGILEAAAKTSNVSKIVFASTSAVYEGNSVPYREGMMLKPPDLKAFSKKVNEEMAEVYRQRYHLDLIALRPFSVYGDDESSKGRYANVASLFSWAMHAGHDPIIWGSGQQTRDFIHASDVARAFVLALRSDTRQPCLNVGTGIETSFLELIQLIGSKLGITPTPVHVPAPVAIYAERLLADTTMCEEQIGFQPKVNLSAGVDRVLEKVEVLRKSDVFASLAEAQLAVFEQLSDQGLGGISSASKRQK
jgi:UDP-glucose 4-epimerase